jgi:pullulanase/glycogen debranching enzyme
MPLPDWLEAGSPYPLGATFEGMGVNFAVFSANAEKIELCLFSGIPFERQDKAACGDGSPFRPGGTPV